MRTMDRQVGAVIVAEGKIIMVLRCVKRGHWELDGLGPVSRVADKLRPEGRETTFPMDLCWSGHLTTGFRITTRFNVSTVLYLVILSRISVNIVNE